MTAAPENWEAPQRSLPASLQGLEGAGPSDLPAEGGSGLPEAPRGRSDALTFVVVGRPAPKGSKSWKGTTKAGRPRMVEASQLLPAWMQAVTLTALQQSHPAIEGPLAASIAFRFQRPDSHYGKRGLLPSAPQHMASVPDLDKLQRAVFDALQDAGLLRNDSRVVCVNASKGWCRAGEPQGAVITLLPLA